MARRHGRNARIMIDTSSGAASDAVVVSLFNSWSVDQSRDFTDATVFGDSNVVELAGLPRAAMSFDGLIDLGTANYANLADGNARRTYIYPDYSNHSGVYWFTTAVFSAQFSGSVTDTVKASVSGTAASDLKNSGSGI